MLTNILAIAALLYAPFIAYMFYRHIKKTLVDRISELEDRLDETIEKLEKVELIQTLMSCSAVPRMMVESGGSVASHLAEKIKDMGSSVQVTTLDFSSPSILDDLKNAPIGVLNDLRKKLEAEENYEALKVLKKAMQN